LSYTSEDIKPSRSRYIREAAIVIVSNQGKKKIYVAVSQKKLVNLSHVAKKNIPC
jgi:hypothetical protein